LFIEEVGNELDVNATTYYVAIRFTGGKLTMGTGNWRDQIKFLGEEEGWKVVSRISNETAMPILTT